EKEVSPLLQLLRYFWGPIPWMIEVAALLSLVVRHWTDLAIIGFLLVFNAAVGFWQEHQAANALEALKGELALTARVRRDGRWQKLPARGLVPGDLIRLGLGDIVPADVKLARGDFVMIDQSALTGESLPVEKKNGDVAYSGSTVRQGEMAALVAATGAGTYFARTARLVEKAGAASHFQKAVLAIGDYLIYLSVLLAFLLVLAQLFRGEHPLVILQFVLILVIAAIPVAMPAVLSVTMALGALKLSRMKAIVSRLQSIEEIAGIDVLCSDKTGTLTRNQLTLGKVHRFAAADDQDLILAAALVSDRESPDAIDAAVLGGLPWEKELDAYRPVSFVPFDPVRKRTEAVVRDAGGRELRVAKGAPQVIMEMCRLSREQEKEAGEAVDQLAQKGYRTLGVARAAAPGSWQLLGLLPLYDPPREDSADTIKRAIAHGIQVKMVTGDNVAIAREIARELGLPADIVNAEAVFGADDGADRLAPETQKRIEAADGFAQVFPEHKYSIVKTLQARDHLVAMTGDGVNDAPALKQADVGIAVSGATDAARAAAALVLTAPGLSVIIDAVEEARRIFERMTSYAIYRITETIRIMFFVVAAMIVFNFYPITTVMIVLLAVLNDLPIMTIAYDQTLLKQEPVRWDMPRVMIVATVLGLIGVLETFLLLVIARNFLRVDGAQLSSVIYLKLAVAGHLTLFVARTPRPMWSRPFPAPLLVAAVLSTQAIAALIVGFGVLVPPIPWRYVGFIWAYCLAWVVVEDWAKREVYRHLELQGPRHLRFLRNIRRTLHNHPG
ncbi:MAG: plasma-membrane proton-efflux P-type ATPase, partial [Desulfobacteraceae bacterium]|nr:plasma-membrane proton-efflux P-type ATPase [Desulfobacteraceae bacterium]